MSLASAESPNPEHAPTTVRLIDLPTVRDPRGALTAMELNSGLPFRPERIYYLTEVPSAASRGGHAHRRLQQILIAVHGRFRVDLWHDGSGHSFYLERPDQGLFLPAMCWRTVGEFSSDAVCLVLASDPYNSDDYIRDLDHFRKEMQGTD